MKTLTVIILVSVLATGCKKEKQDPPCKIRVKPAPDSLTKPDSLSYIIFYRLK